jgi:hypothetical protein
MIRRKSQMKIGEMAKAAGIEVIYRIVRALRLDRGDRTELDEDGYGVIVDGFDGEGIELDALPTRWEDLETLRPPGPQWATSFWGEDPPTRQPDEDFVTGYRIQKEGYHLTVQHGTQKRWYAGEEAQKFIGAAVDAELVHFAVYWDGDEFDLYLNGVTQVPWGRSSVSLGESGNVDVTEAVYDMLLPRSETV